MNTSKNVILAMVFSLAFSLTASAQAATTAPNTGSAPTAKATGMQKLDMTGAPKLQFYKSLPVQVKPADAAPTSPADPSVTTPAAPADTNTTQAAPATPAAPAAPASPATTQPATAPSVTPGTSPDITPKQIEDFLTKHGMDADKAKAASNPTGPSSARSTTTVTSSPVGRFGRPSTRVSCRLATTCLRPLPPCLPA
jgi:hypothetical protein